MGSRGEVIVTHIVNLMQMHCFFFNSDTLVVEAPTSSLTAKSVWGALRGIVMLSMMFNTQADMELFSFFLSHLFYCFGKFFKAQIKQCCCCCC